MGKKIKNVTCWTCGDKIDYDESYQRPGDRRSYLCRYCYEDMCEECSYCDEYIEPKEMADALIVADQTAKELGLKQGLYNIVHYPFFYGNILTGFEGFFEDSIKFLFDLPNLSTDFTSGRICKSCYTRITEGITKVI